MFARLRPNTIAGLLSLLAAALVGTIWYIYLFVAPVIPRSLTLSVVESLRCMFSPDNANRWHFVGLAALFGVPPQWVSRTCSMSAVRERAQCSYLLL